MDEDPGQYADAGDQRPQRQDRAPVQRAAEQHAAFAVALAFPWRRLVATAAPPPRWGSSGFSWALVRALARAVARDLGRRADAVFRRQLIEAGAAALSSLSPRHRPVPGALAPAIDRN